MGKGARIAAAAALLIGLTGTKAAQQQPDVSLPIFPADNPWNWDVSGFAVDLNSVNIIKAIGEGLPIREDYAFPYSVVQNGQADVTVAFNNSPAYPDESDPGWDYGSLPDGTLSTYSSGYYPIPNGAPIEDGGDAHCIVIHEGRKLLYETYRTKSGSHWRASCGAVFKLDANYVRPDGWTSADAAGLPIFPGLIRYDEAVAGTIPHALRFTCPSTLNAHIYPARHHTGTSGANLPPMGLRLRLKATTDLSGYSGVALNILQGLKKYGMIVADNGSPWYISTTLDDRWSSTNIPQIRNMRGSDFEVVVTVDGGGNPVQPVANGTTVITAPPGSGPPAPSGGGGGGGAGGCGLLGLELVLIWAARRAFRPFVSPCRA